MNLLNLFFYDMNHNTRLALELDAVVTHHIHTGIHRQVIQFWMDMSNHDFEYAIKRLEDSEAVTPSGSQMIRIKAIEIERIMKRGNEQQNIADDA